MTKKNQSFFQKLSIFKILVFFVLSLYIFGLVSLFFYAFNTALKSADAFSDDPVSLVGFSQATFDSFVICWENFYVQPDITQPPYYVEHMLLFSLLYAGGCALAITFSTALMAYACSMFPCKMSSLIYSIVIFTIIFPIIGSQPSEMAVIEFLQLDGTFVGNWFMKFSFTNMYFLVIYEAFRRVPKDYREAAQMDGASMWHIMTRIMFRMVFNILGTVFIVQFVALWNDYSSPVLYLSNRPTLALGLMNFRYHYLGVPAEMAAALIVVIPLVILFIVFQKKLLGDLSAGGIKG